MSTLPVSAVIVSYGRCADLRRCLASLARQLPAIASVIVVDNGSTDGTQAMVRSEFPWVRLIASPKNLGACVARNLGALACDEPILWFLDSDTEIIPDDGAAQLHTIFQDASIVAAGGEALLNAAGHSIGVKRHVVRANGIVQGETRLTASAEVEILASCNLMLRRSAFEALGGFDPFYFFFYEDIDLSWRLSHQIGRLLAVAPMPVVHHFSESMRVRRLWPEARNRAYFCAKNFSWGRLLALPLNDLAFLLNSENLRRLTRRAAKSADAKSLVTLTELAPGGAGKWQRLALLGLAFGAKLVMTYLALPLVLRAALVARRGALPLTAATLPPAARALLAR